MDERHDGPSADVLEKRPPARPDPPTRAMRGFDRTELRGYDGAMFEVAELGRKVEKDEYDARVPELRAQLLAVQRALLSADFPVLVLLNGMDGAGRSETLNQLHEWMDARFLIANALGPSSREERSRPEAWRYWMALPSRGRVGVFLGNWYTEPLLERAFGKLDDADLHVRMARINAFEQLLADDGALLIKLWFHISRDEQNRRIKKLRKDPLTRWRVSDEDLRAVKHHEDIRSAAELTMRLTSTAAAPWTIIEGTDHRYRELAVAEHLLEQIKRRMERPRPPRATSVPATVEDPQTILDTLDLTKTIDKETYDTKLAELQARLNGLGREVQARGRGVIAVFEGWDAAGKGGAIRRVIHALDARQYRVIPIAAPTDEERARPYLWRFWRHLPGPGRFTIYDRSWYGRVLVERVEGFASEDEWGRAYKEINDFEEQLVEFGIVLVKFWLHISPAEQLRRFEERKTLAWKQHKISDEDWRNRDKWSAYESAANDMIGRTSTQAAPWTLVESESKHYGRVKVLKTLCRAIERSLR